MPDLATALAGLDKMAAVAAEVKAALLQPDIDFVPAGGFLQGALDRSDWIEFEGVHEGHFFMRRPGQKLIGRPGARMHGPNDTDPTLYIPDGSYNLHLESFQLTTAGSNIVFRAGSPTNTKLEDEVHQLTLKNIIIPTYRAKCGFSFNARDVALLACEVRDGWSPNLQDDQPLHFGNSSGNVLVDGGFYEGASENILFGGATRYLPVPGRNAIIRNATLSKPLSWQNDGVARAIKNLIEFKDFADVMVLGNHMIGSWHGRQYGYAITITPRLNGIVGIVHVEDNIVENCGTGIQLMGRNYSTYTPTRASLLCKRNTFRIDHTLYGGYGYLALILGEVDSAEFIDNDIAQTGSRLLVYDFGTVMEVDGTTHEGGPANVLRLKGNRSTLGSGGVRLDGFTSSGSTTAYDNGGASGQGFASARELDISGNEFRGPNISSVMKRNFPNNTYVTTEAASASTKRSSGRRRQTTRSTSRKK